MKYDSFTRMRAVCGYSQVDCSLLLLWKWHRALGHCMIKLVTEDCIFDKKLNWCWNMGQAHVVVFIREYFNILPRLKILQKYNLWERITTRTQLLVHSVMYCCFQVFHHILHFGLHFKRLWANEMKVCVYYRYFSQQ